MKVIHILVLLISLYCDYTECNGNDNEDNSIEEEIFTNFETQHDETYKECGKTIKLDQNTGFIFENDEVNGPGAWPWLVSIGEKGVEFWQHKCGGSLITRKHVITAAHCPLQLRNKLKRGEVFVRAGDGHLQNDTDDIGVQTVAVHSYVNHPDFNRKARYSDVGMLKLANSLALTRYVRTICPPNPSLREEDDRIHLVVAGWGDSSKSQAGKDLTYAYVQVYPESYCNYTHLGQNRYHLAVPRGFTDDLFCGGDSAGSAGTCRGDSGSPAVFFEPFMKRYVLKGVVSGGLSCGTLAHPNIYVRVGSKDILYWIHQEVSKAINLVSTRKPPRRNTKKPATQPQTHQDIILEEKSSGWSSWESWSQCSRGCGVGKKSRKRYCTGANCRHREQSQQRFCNTQRCTYQQIYSG